MIIGSLLLILVSLIILSGLLIILLAPLIVHLPQFGAAPEGERKARIERSPHYCDGQFQNLASQYVVNLSIKQSIRYFRKLLFERKSKLRPAKPIEMAYHDLNQLDKEKDYFVWFGHASYLLSIHGTTFLVDPTLCHAAPFAIINRPFKGTTRYSPEQMPAVIDYLIITHDHYDHLDYHTYLRLKSRVRHIICPLGVGAHLERWGTEGITLTESDWDESIPISEGWQLHCLPSQHFSGRGLNRNNTLWASYLLESPYGNIFMGCDGGYGPHFKEIGTRFTTIDLAIIENGQYDEQWRNIHILPRLLGIAVKDLGARQVITIHHSKYAMAHHVWDEPLRNEQEASQAYKFPLIVAQLGAPTELNLRA